MHPTDRVLTIHWLEDGRYGRPQTLEMRDRVTIGVLPEATVD